MEFHQLRYFVVTAEERSITAAAKRLHLSQPALSRQIRALEEELGVALFDRIKQRIYLTEAGGFFLERARRMLCDAETSVQRLRERFGEAKRTIRLGFLTIFLDDIVAPAVRAMRKESPRIEVALYELSPKAQLDRLRDGELDLALLGNLAEEDRSRYTVRSLMRNPMAIVLPDDHRLADRRQVALKELAGERFASLSDTMFPERRQFLRQICRSQGFDPEIGEESDSIALLLAAVSSGEGVALLPAHSGKLPHSGCVFVKMSTPVVHAEVMAVHRKGSDEGALASFLGHLASAAREIA